MIVAKFALLLLAITALISATRLYGLARVPQLRHRLGVAMTIFLSLLALFLIGGASGWLVAIAVGLLIGSGALLINAWAWKWDNFIMTRTERALAARPDLEQKAASNPILRRLMKRPPP